MERNILKELLAWKDKANRKPLILQGARQVGKTWVMKEFGREAFEYTAYINMDNNDRMRMTFDRDFDVSRIIEELGIESGTKMVPGKTLIIMDEVQEVPKAISSLKYFCENAPEYHVIVAGSLLGVALHKGISYPVGKVDLLSMYPMTFVEFLNAVGETKLASQISDYESDVHTVFADKYISYLKKYYYIGGMPEVVKSYIEEKDYSLVRKLQNEILQLYEQDFGKHIDNKTELERTRMVWNSIPMQLSKENKKFFFGKIKKGARSADYEISIQWLIDCGLLYKVHCVNKPGMPLRAYKEFSAYKLFMVDVGLLGAMSNLDSRSILEGNKIFTEFKGALTEQYVHQQIIGSTDLELFYYSNQSSTNEIDFLTQIESNIIPIEVKAEENLNSKSLKAFVDKYSPDISVRFSMKNYIEQDWLVNIPLWEVSEIVSVLMRDAR
ncbi:MAG: ATP-binding protein [Lachnospiraceae bacterium]|nr:ATP-binding protein [Lachnospiraceae bacterium]